MKFLDEKGVQHLWSKISMEDYPNNETLIAVLNAIDQTKANKDEISLSIESALTEAKESGDFNGNTGDRGTSILRITTSPSAYTTAINNFTPSYRINLSTVLSQANVDKVLIGDTILCTYYTYPVGYIDDNYVYLGARASIRGATGATPVKGTNYFTDEDKIEMITQVKNAMPTLIVTGIDFDGISHTWEMYGVTR